MKIIYFANARIPTEKAHGLQIMKMAESFAGAGIELELVLPTRINDEFKNTDLFTHYQVKNNFKVKKIKSPDPVFLLKLPAGVYIKFQLLLFIISLFFYLLFKKNKNDFIFYSRDEHLLPLLQLFSKKVVWEGHSLHAKKRYYQKYFKQCLLLVVLTGQLRKELVDLGIEADKIIIAPDAVDLAVFAIKLTQEAARQKVNLPPGKIILGYTGSFKTKGMDKGIGDILKALKILSQENLNVLFMAVGGIEPDILDYKNQAEDLGIGDRVLLLKPVSQNRLAIYQKAFDVLLMPFPDKPHYRYYMSPLKMFEYLAAGRPIIASDLPSIKEVLSEQNCLFCQPDNPADLAAKIKLILQDRDLSDRMVKQSQRDSLSYTWENRAAKIIQAIGGI